MVEKENTIFKGEILLDINYIEAIRLISVIKN